MDKDYGQVALSFVCAKLHKTKYFFYLLQAWTEKGAGEKKGCYILLVLHPTYMDLRLNVKHYVTWSFTYVLKQILNTH